ncbi:MAG: hypothetical protein KDJ52_20285 [Anaerolineae bacterium]|nr:hypothetical protein [Anaerolineae bacterium]
MNYSELAKQDLYQQLKICEENIAYHTKLNEVYESMTSTHQEQLIRLSKWHDKLLTAIERLNETQLPPPPPRDAVDQIFLEVECD